MQLDFLSTIVAWLDEAEIPHMLAGSMASTYHGEPRMTRDIDMVIDPTPESMDRFVAALVRPRFYVDGTADAVRRRGVCNVIDTDTGWKVDLIIRKDRPFSVEEFQRRESAVIGDTSLFVATAEDTVLAKLEWRARSGSDRQFEDVVGVLAAQDVDLEYLRHWSSELGVAESLERALVAASERR